MVTTGSEDEARKGGTTWPLWVFVSLIIYILGTGPVTRLGTTTPRFMAVVKVVYAPVRLLVVHCPPARSFFQWYIGLWMPSFFGGLPKGGW